MYPMTSDDGVTFIVDDWKAPLWIMQSAFDFLQAAEAGRKFIAIGTISDYGGTTASVYSRVARAALDVADQIGRASSRERVCPYVLISVVAVSLKKITCLDLTFALLNDTDCFTSSPF